MNTVKTAETMDYAELRKAVVEAEAARDAAQTTYNALFAMMLRRGCYQRLDGPFALACILEAGHTGPHHNPRVTGKGLQ